MKHPPALGARGNRLAKRAAGKARRAEDRALVGEGYATWPGVVTTIAGWEPCVTVALTLPEPPVGVTTWPFRGFGPVR